MFNIFLALSFLLILCGCAASTKEDLYLGYANKYEFNIQDNYQTVYKRVVEKARICWETGYLFSPQARNVIDADLYTELGEGEVSWRMVNLGSSYYATVKIKKDTSNNTNVKVWNALNSWNLIGQRVENWATGELDAGC